jgi:hypothetical protein
MERNTSEADIHSAGKKKNPLLLWNLKFQNHAQKSPPLVPILSQMNPVHTTPSYFFTIQGDLKVPARTHALGGARNLCVTSESPCTI